jgi:cytochrome oxidase assembly protein ShyY1
VYRFLLSRRWLGFAALVVVVAGVCIRLGMWQFDRLDQRQADNERIEDNLTVAPAPVDTVVLGDSVDPDDEWRRVTVTGRYDADHQVLLTDQTRDIGPGVDVLTPLLTPTGSAVLVDRGWLAIDDPSDLPDPPDPPVGDVSVTGWLRVDSDVDDWAITPDDGTVRAVASDGIEASLPYDLLPGWIALIDQQPPADSGLEPPEEPDLGQGPHFFYGLQWWFFAALAVGGYIWFAWVEAHPRPGRESTEAASQPPVSSGASGE